MAFKIAARTVIQLGAELISSDSIAFYELIKNAFDARSASGARVIVRVRIPYPLYGSLRRLFSSDIAFKELKSQVIAAIDRTTDSGLRFGRRFESVDNKEELRDLFVSANYIEIRDTGEGMSKRQLETVYLTIGTTNRLRDKQQHPSQTYLGEKGLGRLAAMRLGMRLKVTTTRKGENHWNVLRVDWNKFAESPDDLLENVEIAPESGEPKDDPSASGTVLRISDLNGEWNQDKLQEIAKDEFSRLMDPFSPPQMKLVFRFNDDVIQVPPIPRILFTHADADLTASFQNIHGQWELRGEIYYRFRNRKKSLHLTESHILSVAGLSSRRELDEIGAFSVICYWFNRRRLSAIEGIGDLKTVKRLVDEWGGGLMLFRNGFRVHPYGGPADDWLELDPIAFKSQGYKVNRKQVIGKVDITKEANPNLIDQTNREGLRDNSAKKGFVAILQRILSDLRIFVTNIDDDFREKAALDIEDLERRVDDAQVALEQTIQELTDKYPGEKRLASSLRSTVEDVRHIFEQSKEVAENAERRQNQLVHLAGIGLMVEVVAHELNRSAQYTLSLLSETDLDQASDEIQSTLEILQSQLKTIQKRLRILDPVSTAGRQVKEKFDLIEWTKEVLQSHDAQFRRHNIKVRVRSIPPDGQFRVRAVKGMIVQVLENLIANSVYWLKREKLQNQLFEPEINISVDSQQRQLRFSDNGPGIQPDQKEEVFLPFVTTKPARQGKGLGLYIAKEIAQYHAGHLYLSEKATVHPKALNTFVLELPEEKQK